MLLAHADPFGTQAAPTKSRYLLAKERCRAILGAALRSMRRRKRVKRCGAGDASKAASTASHAGARLDEPANLGHSVGTHDPAGEQRPLNHGPMLARISAPQTQENSTVGAAL